jgi:hypothetical protein
MASTIDETAVIQQGQLQTGPYGTVIEEQFGTAEMIAAKGDGLVAWPLVDLGLDSYLRRRRTMRVHPIQNKSLRELAPNGLFELSIPVDKIVRAPTGYMAICHAPAPEYRYSQIWLPSIERMYRECPRWMVGDVEKFLFQASPAMDRPSLWDDCLYPLDQLSRWFDTIPGWKDPIAPSPAARRGPKDETVLPPTLTLPHKGEGALGGATELVAPEGRKSLSLAAQLWVAQQLLLAGGADIVVARERLRVDGLDLLFHHLPGHHFAGVQVKTGVVNPLGRLHFLIRRDTFFVDKDFWVVLLPTNENGSPHPYAFLLNSADIPELTQRSTGSDENEDYQGTMYLGPTGTERFLPFRVPTANGGVGRAFLESVLGRAEAR